MRITKIALLLGIFSLGMNANDKTVVEEKNVSSSVSSSDMAMSVPVSEGKTPSDHSHDMPSSSNDDISVVSETTEEMTMSPEDTFDLGSAKAYASEEDENSMMSDDMMSDDMMMDGYDENAVMGDDEMFAYEEDEALNVESADIAVG
jgi:hypothetical protein